MRENEQNLGIEKAGFERVGVSNIYHKGFFAVQVNHDGTKNLLIDFSDCVRWSDLIAIKQGSDYGSARLMALDNRGYFVSLAPGGGGSYGGDAPLEMRSTKETIRQQLKSMGFVESESEKNVLRRMFPIHKEEIELIALMDKEKLLRVFSSIRKSTLQLLGNRFEILGYHDEKTEYTHRNISVIEVENNFMRFQITSEISGMIKDGSQKLTRRITEEELGIIKPEIIIEASGFKVGGSNSTEIIRNAKEINGISIAELERRMRPNKYSMSGFLGVRESLTEVLASDNEYVHSLGLTHQDLSGPLKYALYHVSSGRGENFVYEGHNYEVKMIGWRGSQDSPFEDKTSTSVDLHITNVDTGKQIHFSGLLPDMIERYGFYEGKGTDYRLEPASIIEVFDFLVKK